jgi:hypothetical protein
MKGEGAKGGERWSEVRMATRTLERRRFTMSKRKTASTVPEKRVE